VNLFYARAIKKLKQAAPNPTVKVKNLFLAAVDVV
jgi:hypothetical protein